MKQTPAAPSPSERSISPWRYTILPQKGEEPPSNMHDVRAGRCTACSEVEVDYVVFLPFLRRPAHQSTGTGEPDQPPQAGHTCWKTGTAALGTCGFARGRGSRLERNSRVVVGAVSKERSSSRQINFLLRKLGFGCLAYDIALELVWVLTWANPADAPSRNKPIESLFASLLKLPSAPTGVLASPPVLSELDHLREPLSVAA